jgi:hypothetical protein
MSGMCAKIAPPASDSVTWSCLPETNATSPHQREDSAASSSGEQGRKTHSIPLRAATTSSARGPKDAQANAAASENGTESDNANTNAFAPTIEGTARRGRHIRPRRTTSIPAPLPLFTCLAAKLPRANGAERCRQRGRGWQGRPFTKAMPCGYPVQASPTAL